MTALEKRGARLVEEEVELFLLIHNTVAVVHVVTPAGPVGLNRSW